MRWKMAYSVLTETDLKVNKVAERFSETVHLMLNDPSMGLYRIQEHGKRSLPTLVEKKVELKNLQSSIQGACYDLDYSLKTVKSINWNPHFTIIQACLKSAIASKSNLEKSEYEQTTSAGQKPNIQEDQDLSLQDPVEVNECPSTENCERGHETLQGFICPACMKAWQSQEELLTHWASMHNSKSDTNDK